MERRFFKNAPVETREEAENGAPRLHCRFAVFNESYDLWDDAYERIDPHAFDETVADDVRALWNHDTNIVLGRTTSGTLRLGVMAEGLDGDIDINPEDRAALDGAARVKRRDVTGCSIGFDILEEHIERRSDGKTGFVIDKIKLYEVSICTFPAYETTYAESRSVEDMRLKAWKYNMKERLKNA